MHIIVRSRAVMSAIALVTGVGLLLAGCGGNDTVASPDPTTTASAAADATARNEADVMFAQMMIPHHREAVDMAKLASSQASDPEVKQLAMDIMAAQEPEIATMTGWLQQWGESVPTAGTMGGSDDMGSGDMGTDDMGSDDMGQEMPGAMSEADMKKLEAASGTAFDTQFLTMMVAHHEGAISMAEKEQANGANAEAKSLAGDIITAQQAEIVTIKGILARL